MGSPEEAMRQSLWIDLDIPGGDDERGAWDPETDGGAPIPLVTRRARPRPSTLSGVVGPVSAALAAIPDMEDW